ncbi:MAG: hypothetical protein ABI321_12670 [Polyangia bacterium]
MRLARMKRALLLISVVVLASIAAYAPTGDPDLWWHLAAARLAIADPVHANLDHFSYSYAGTALQHRDALAEQVLYRGYLLLGFAWFVLLKAFAGAMQGAALWIAQPRRQRSVLVTLVGTIVLLATIRLVERPNLFTVAVFPLFVALLERARRALHEPRIAMKFGAVVACAWAWMALHRGGLLSIPLVGLFAAYTTVAYVLPSAMAERYLGPRPTRVALGLSWTAAVLTLAFTLLSPGGLAALLSGIGVVERTSLRSSISEWTRMTPVALVQHFPVAMLLGLLALALTLRSLVVRRVLGLWHLGLLALFVGATLDSVRWVPYLAAVACQLVVLEVCARMHAWERSPKVRLVPLLVTAAGIACVVATHGGPFAMGEDAGRVPRAAADLLESEHLGDRVANALELGGYLVWRDAAHVHVLIDGRNETLYPPSFFARALEAEHDRPTFEAMRAEDRATVVVAVNTPGRLTTPFLRDDPAWALVGWSDPATVWVRRDAHAELASRLAYGLLDPRSLDGSVARALGTGADRAQLSRELERMVTQNPNAVRPLVALAVYHHIIGDLERRDLVLARLDALAPDHPAVRALHARFIR